MIEKIKAFLREHAVRIVEIVKIMGGVGFCVYMTGQLFLKLALC